MKRFITLVSILAVSVSLAGVAAAADQKIATADLAKIFARYYKTIQSNAAINQEVAEIEKDRKKMVEDAERHNTEWQKLIDKANDQAVSADERDKSKKEAEQKYVDLERDKQAIKEFDQVATTRLHEKQLQRRDDILKEIRQVLKADAQTAGYSMVLDVSGESQNLVPVILFTNGQNDLTDALIKELNSTAPPGALDTNAAPISALGGNGQKQ